MVKLCVCLYSRTVESIEKLKFCNAMFVIDSELFFLSPLRFFDFSDHCSDGMSDSTKE